MLAVSVASTDRDLTTTGALKALILGATATSTLQDVRLSALIRQASRWAETFVGYPLTVQSYRESVAGFGRRNLMLARVPIVAVSAVYDATDTGTATLLNTSEYRVEDTEAGFLSRDQGFAWTASMQWRSGPRGTFGTAGDAIPLEPQPMPGQEYKPWLCDYVAGWTYNGVSTSSPNWSTVNGSTSTGRTMPEDIEQAVLLRAQELHVNPLGVVKEVVGDLSVQYNARSVNLDSPAEIMLLPYQRAV